MSDLCRSTLESLSVALEQRKFTAELAVSQTLEQISKVNPTVNAYTDVLENSAVSDAKQADAEIQNGKYRGPMHGIPIALKDMVFTKGIRTTMASPIYETFLPEQDAYIVSKLKDAGAVLIGKLNMHQFAFGATGDRSLQGPARNPHDLEHICGGSSSGSAAALAANMAHATIGTDTGGSIRIPASCCGIVGMKPTFGSVSKSGVFPLSWTLDHIGPMTRTVKDNAIFLNALVDHDPEDPFSISREPEDFSRLIGKPIEGFTIGIPENYYFDIMDSAVWQVFQETVKKLTAVGVTFKSVKVEYLDEALAAHQLILPAEGFVSLEKEIRNGSKLMDAEVLTRTLAGRHIDAYSYIRALQVKSKVIDAHVKAFEGLDALITPTLCILPPKINQREIMVNGSPHHARSIVRMVAPTNLTGFPAISVPGGKVGTLPVGIQLIGLPLTEAKLYQIAHYVEQIND